MNLNNLDFYNKNRKMDKLKKYYNRSMKKDLIVIVNEEETEQTSYTPYFFRARIFSMQKRDEYENLFKQINEYCLHNHDNKNLNTSFDQVFIRMNILVKRNNSWHRAFIRDILL